MHKKKDFLLLGPVIGAKFYIMQVKTTKSNITRITIIKQSQGAQNVTSTCFHMSMLFCIAH